MALHLFQLILITITTTNLACGELFLKMPLTINPVVQDIITQRSSIWQHVYGQDPTFFSRFTPADIVIQLNHSLAFVMRNTIVGALVLGAASKSAGLQTDHLKYKPGNKWTVNVSLTDIKSILNETEKNISLPLSDGITVTALQKLGLRVLQKRFNVTLDTIAEPLHLSKAMNFQSIQNDWIQVVKFITKINVRRLAAKYQVSVTTLAGALNLTLNRLYDFNLNQLDEVLSKKFQFVKGSFEVLVPTLMTSTVPSTLRVTIQTTSEEKSTISNPSTESSTTPTQALTTSAANQVTDTSIALPFSTTSLSLKTSASVARATNASSSGHGTTTTNLVLFVGVAVGLLLLLVASSTVWCFKRKRRHPADNVKKKINNDIKMNNFWVEKSDSEQPSTQDEPRQEVCFLRSPSGSTTGFDSRFKGMYVSRSSTFIADTPRKMINSIPDFENDTRREIFV